MNNTTNLGEKIVGMFNDIPYNYKKEDFILRLNEMKQEMKKFLANKAIEEM